jgi:hypothetical protein
MLPFLYLGRSRGLCFCLEPEKIVCSNNLYQIYITNPLIFYVFQIFANFHIAYLQSHVVVSLQLFKTLAMWNLLTGSILRALVRSSRSLAVRSLLLRTEPLKTNVVVVKIKSALSWVENVTQMLAM